MNWWKRLTLCSAEGSICQASGALVAVADVVDCKTSYAQSTLSINWRGMPSLRPTSESSTCIPSAIDGHN